MVRLEEQRQFASLCALACNKQCWGRWETSLESKPHSWLPGRNRQLELGVPSLHISPTKPADLGTVVGGRSQAESVPVLVCHASSGTCSGEPNTQRHTRQDPRALHNRFAWAVT